MGFYLAVLEVLDEHHQQHGKRHMTVPANLGILGYFCLLQSFSSFLRAFIHNFWFGSLVFCLEFTFACPL